MPAKFEGREVAAVFCTVPERPADRHIARAMRLHKWKNDATGMVVQRKLG